MRVALELHARSQPEDCWYAALTDRLRVAEASTSRKHAGGAAPRRGDGAMLNGAVAAAVRTAKRGAPAATAGQGA